MSIDGLYALVASVREEKDRRVRTVRGPGRLWQVFRDRVGVILDSRPERVAYFDPEDVSRARGDGG